MTSQTSQPSQPGNELWFTRGTRRYARIGETMRVVTEGAVIEITLDSGGITRVSVTHDAGVSVIKRVRKPAAAKPATAKPATAKPAAKAGAAK
jgi:hypothetical protein